MTSALEQPRPPIAVVGVSALFPGSQDAVGFWSDIRRGADLLGDVPPTHWLVEDYYDPDPSAPDKTYAKRGGFLSPVDFDPIAWGVPPKILRATDTTQLLALIVAEAVLRDAARGRFETMDRSRVSVILGVTSAQELISTMTSRLQRPVWRKALREHGVPEDEVTAICDRIADSYVPWEESSFPGLLGNVVAGRIANRLDLGGTNCVTDAACASTFAALNMAMQELYLGDSDLVLTGGADTLNDIFMFMCFSKTPALSMTGDCRPFSDQADGTMLGEGLGMVALRRLADAERDGDRIYAVIRGVGSSSDGRSKSVYAPVSAGQAQALRRARAHAGFPARTVELIEAHGTGTKAGDVAEFEGLRLAFADEADAAGGERQWCALGSVKSQIGHTKAAAGAAGLFKAVMALHHKVLPPTIKVDRPNPKLAIEGSPFYLNTTARPWIRGSDHPRRAGVSAFGFGGSNFHVAVEEYTGPGLVAERLRTLAAELVVLHGATGAEVAAKAREWAARGDEPGIVEWAAWSSQASFDASAPARLALVAETGPSSGALLRAKLERAATLVEAKPEASFTSPDGSTYGVGPRPGEVAFLFPGQGSQYVGMTADVSMSFDVARAAWDRAADLDFGGQRLHPRVFPISRFDDESRAADEVALRATEWAQPAIGCASLAMLGLMRALGVEATAVAGHSFGEVTALHAAGIVAEVDVLRVARRRGELMAEAGSTGRPGSMSAVVGSAAQVEAALAGIDDVVLANLNAPNQTVVSGPTEAIERAEAALATAGLEVRRLPVASAFHSPVVSGSAEPFARFLDELALSPATIPVYSGESGAPYEADAAAQRARLARQIAAPVRFTKVVEAMADAGIHSFIEVGPGAVLTGLVGQILGERPHAAIALDRRGAEGVTSLARALARLCALGVPLRLGALWEGHRQPGDPRARVMPKLAIPLDGSNYDKPYPPRGGAAVLPPPNPPRSLVPSPQAAPLRSDRPVPKPPEPTPAPPITAPAPTHEVTVGPGWLAAWQEAQRQTAQTHALVHQAMASSHAAYLRATEASLAGLAAMAGVSLPRTHGEVAPAPTQAWAAPLPVAAPMPLPVAAPVSTPVPLAASAPMPVAVHVPAPAPAPVPHVAAPTAVAPAVDLEAIMLRVVADKTGYPEAMLELSMDMEAELGIDSIKRVEILAAVQEQAPGLPEVDASHMGTLRTLGEIVAYMQSLMGSAPIAAPVASTPAAPAVDLEAIMLRVVADKTGYPEAMLELSMDMEAELGIDSIKRVEILAAVQEQAPGLPEVDASHMGTLRTLGEIVAYMQSLMGGSTPTREAPATSEATRELAATPRLALAESPTLGRYALELCPAPAIGLAQAGLHAEGGVVVCGHAEIGAALVAELRGRGIEARTQIEVPADAGAVVLLSGLRDVTTIDEALAIDREAFRVARTLAPAFTARGGLFVTVQDTGGGFGLEPCPPLRAYLAGLPALVKTAKQEWPEAGLQAIDLDRAGRSPAELARVIADELLLGGGALEVALAADGRRRTLRSFPCALAPSEAHNPIRPGDVVVVSGGARGVTAACVIEWAKDTRARFVLLGRSRLEPEPPSCAGATSDAALKRAMFEAAQARGETLDPAELARRVSAVLSGREVRQTLAAIAAAGGEGRYVSVDVTNHVAVAAALAEVRAAWGPIVGLVHGAGVLADKRIAELGDEAFERVLATKITGLRALLDATKTDALRVLCLFSSVSARCGNNGQAAYAMANELLNKVAQVEARARPQARVRALDWGPWEGGMVGPQLREHFARLGVPMIPLEVGARMLADELAGAPDPDPRRVELVLGGEPRPEALLVKGSEARALELEVHVDRKTHGYLADHAIGGTVVVPVVLAIEWLSRLAHAYHPELHLRALTDVRVLRGIKLRGFDRGGDRLRLRCRSIGNGEGHGATLALEILGVDGALHYRATAKLGATAQVLERGGEALGGPLRPWGGAAVYDGDVLFHGRDFQVIDALDGVAEDGISGTLRGVRAAGWTWEPWQTDVAALDGGLQMAVLWAREHLGGATLPMGIGEIRLAEAPVAEGPLRIVAKCRKTNPSHAIVDVILFDAAGTRRAELRHTELVLRPDQPSAPRLLAQA